MRAGGQVVEHEHHLVGEHRRERLHAVHRNTVRDLVEHVEELGMQPRQLAGPGPDLRGEQQFTARRCEQPAPAVLAVGRIGQRPLVGYRERPDVLDLVTEELHPQRMLLGRREDVEDATAHRDLATPLHQVHPVVGDADKPVHDFVEVGAVTDAQPHRFEIAEAGDLGLEDGPHRRHHNRQRRLARAVGVGEPAQHGEAESDRVGSWGQPFVRQGLPAREHRDRLRIDQARQRRGKIVSFPSGGGDGQYRPPGPDRERGGGERSQRSRSRQVQPGFTDCGDRACQGRIRTWGGGKGVQQRGEGHKSVRTSREQRTLQTDGKVQMDTQCHELGRSSRTGPFPTGQRPTHTTAFPLFYAPGNRHTQEVALTATQPSLTAKRARVAAGPDSSLPPGVPPGRPRGRGSASATADALPETFVLAGSQRLTVGLIRADRTSPT